MDAYPDISVGQDSFCRDKVSQKFPIQSTKYPNDSFQQFLQRKDEDVLSFFHQIFSYVEQGRGFFHYHFRILNHENKMQIHIVYGTRNSPKQGVPCLSCPQDGTSFSPTQTSLLFGTSEKNNLQWLDSQDRPAFIVTPAQHVERLLDLPQEQILDFFRCASNILQTELSSPDFAVIKLNHGDFRNCLHLHLKIFVPQELYDSNPRIISLKQVRNK